MEKSFADGWFDVQRTAYKRINIVTSFYGFEEPCHLPPNINMTGPLIPFEQQSLVDRLHEKDPELGEWLDDA